jgi:hypothetical protein
MSTALITQQHEEPLNIWRGISSTYFYYTIDEEKLKRALLLSSG